MALAQPIKYLTTSGGANPYDSVIIFNGGAFTPESITLPSSPTDGQKFYIIRSGTDGITPTVNIDPSPNTIQKQSSLLLTPGTTLELMFYQGDWIIIGGNLRIAPGSVPISGSTVKIFATTPLPQNYVNPSSLNIFTTDGPSNDSAIFPPGLINYGRTVRCEVTGFINSLVSGGHVEFTITFDSVASTTSSFTLTPEQFYTNIPVTLQWKLFFMDPTFASNPMGMLTVNYQEDSYAAFTKLSTFTAPLPWDLSAPMEIYGTITPSGNMTFTLMSAEIYID
jgi:hypothetical protein